MQNVLRWAVIVAMIWKIPSGHAHTIHKVSRGHVAAWCAHKFFYKLSAICILNPHALVNVYHSLFITILMRLRSLNGWSKFSVINAGHLSSYSTFKSEWRFSTSSWRSLLIERRMGGFSTETHHDKVNDSLNFGNMRWSKMDPSRKPARTKYCFWFAPEMPRSLSRWTNSDSSRESQTPVSGHVHATSQGIRFECWHNGRWQGID